MRMQFIVVVQQGHVLSARDLEGRVRCLCNMAIAVTDHVTDSRIHGCVFGQNPGDVRLRRSIVGYAQLPCRIDLRPNALRSEEHTSELQSLMRISYAVFCLKKKKNKKIIISLEK